MYHQNNTRVNTIKVCIVEDDPEFQEWLSEELAEASHIECLGIFSVAEDAMAKIPVLRPNIVLMDLGLEKSSIGGIECMLRLKLVSPELRFMVVTSYGDDEKVFEALKVGAGAYILKGDISRSLIDRLDEFSRGGAPMSAEIARKVITTFHREAADLALLQQLSPREKDILDLLAKGFMYKEIAGMLHNENDQSKTISEGTVKIHAFNVYQKLQVNSRIEAMKKYLNRI